MSETPRHSVTIANPGEWLRKIELFRSSGIHSLQVISDWDRTLTAPHTAKGLDQSTYSLLYNSNLLGTRFNHHSEALYKTYRQIELSTRMDEVEKSARMNEWWTAQFDLLIAHGFSNAIVKTLLEGGRLTMREGAWEFLRTLNVNLVPILILSAGIANVIEEQLWLHGAATLNVHISANQLTMDPAGIARKYDTPLIHTLNKASRPARLELFANAVSLRPNLLLLGDTLEDARMEFVTQHVNVIRIGFLCDPNLLDRFSYVYDAVVDPDGSFEIANCLLDIYSGEASVSNTG